LNILTQFSPTPFAHNANSSPWRVRVTRSWSERKSKAVAEYLYSGAVVYKVYIYTTYYTNVYKVISGHATKF